MVRAKGSKVWLAGLLGSGLGLVTVHACAQKPAPQRAPASAVASAAILVAPGPDARQTWRRLDQAEALAPADELEAPADPGASPDAPVAAKVDAAVVAPDIEGAAEALASGDARRALDLTRGLMPDLQPVSSAPPPAASLRALAIRASAALVAGDPAEAVLRFEALRAREGWAKELVPEVVEFEYARALAALADTEPDRVRAQALRNDASGVLADALERKSNREKPAMRVARARVQAAMRGDDDKAEFWAAVRAVRSLDGVLRDYPNHPEYAQLRLTRARTLVRAKKYSQAADAYRATAIEEAGRPEAQLAWRELEALAEAQPKRVGTPTWTTRMKLDAAKAARNARFVEHSREILDALLEDEDLARNYRREAERSRAQTARRQRDWDQCIADLLPHWERTGNFETRDELSRCYERGERYDELLALWLDGVAKKSRAQQEQAYFRAAEYAFRAGKYRRARELIESYEKRWRGHATERNFMRAMIAEHLGEAGEALDEFKRLAYRSESRKEMSRYYRGKILLRSNDSSQRLEGIEMLRGLVTRGWESLTTSGIYGGFPLYYALQARQRLIEAGVDVQPAPKLEPELVPKDIDDWAATRERFASTLAAHGEVSSALRRADALHAVGQLERARRELRIAIDELLAGLARARGGKLRSPRSEELEQGLGWRASWKLPKPRISKKGRALIRDDERLDDYKARLRELAMALDEPYRVAKLGDYAMPYRQRYFRQAYADAVRPVAERHELDPTHMWALMYTESRFRRHVVSGVGARGALQIMPWTGRQLLQRLGEYDGRFDPDTLFDIETNARLAGFYVAELMKNFHGQPAFVYASYNGGPSNVARWLEAKGGAVVTNPVGLDDYIEEIPFTETHRYTKRVLETQAAYQWMYEGVMPAWSDGIDPKVEHTIEF